ncbi:MAG: AAA family ATPase [Alphaproteobacteria bacterium]|nr:AAA family ATPase [Alphaproteobacteria bacterium]
MSEYNRTPLPPGIRPSVEYIYRDEHGAMHSKVSRYDLGNGEKTFRQWHWEEHDRAEPGWEIGKGDKPRIPYNLDRIVAARQSEDLYICEGEKDADTLSALGFLATTNPGGAENWDPDLNKWFKKRHRIFIQEDNDAAGRMFSRDVALNVSPHAIAVRIVPYPDVKEKGDVTDWFAEGHTKEEFIARCEAAPVFKPPIVIPGLINARDLFGKEFEPVKYIVPGLITEGLTLFAGAPKIGKSWLWLQVGLAVAGGGVTFVNKECQQGDVLYLALEDNQRRLNSRMKKLWDMASQPVPDRLHLATDWPRQDMGGVDRIRDWLTNNPNARLVIVDVLARFKPTTRDKTQGPYDADYAAMNALQSLALEKGVGIVVIHHTRKSLGAGGDYFDEVSGTLALSGGADSTIVLKREAGGVRLMGRGRDLEDFDYAVKLDGLTCQWSILGDTDEVRLSRERTQVLVALKKAEAPLSNKELALACGRKPGGLDKLLFTMAEDGLVVRVERGKYALPDWRPEPKPL